MIFKSASTCQECHNVYTPVSVTFMAVAWATWRFTATWQWGHNERDCVSNHRRLHCLLICWFRPRSKKTSKLRVTGLCTGNSPVTGEFPAQKAVTRKMFPLDNVIMNLLVFRWLVEAGKAGQTLTKDALTLPFGRGHLLSQKNYNFKRNIPYISSTYFNTIGSHFSFQFVHNHIDFGFDNENCCTMIIVLSKNSITDVTVAYVSLSLTHGWPSTQPGTCTQPCPIVHTAVPPLFTQPCPERTMSTAVCIYVAGLCASCPAV